MTSALLTAAEVAKVLRLTPWQVANLCRAGDIRASRPGRAWLISTDDLQAYLDAHSNQREAS